MAVLLAGLALAGCSVDWNTNDVSPVACRELCAPAAVQRLTHEGCVCRDAPAASDGGAK